MTILDSTQGYSTNSKKWVQLEYKYKYKYQVRYYMCAEKSLSGWPDVTVWFLSLNLHFAFTRVGQTVL